MVTGVVLFAVVGIPALLIRHGIIDWYTSQLITMGGVNAVLAVSVHLITGVTGLLSIGQAGFMAIGAYSCIFFTADLGIPLGLSTVLASLFSAFIGLLISFPALKLSGDYLAVVTLSFGEIIRVLLVNLSFITGGVDGRQFDQSLNLNPTLAFLSVTATLAVILVFLQNYLNSTYGRATLAVREDDLAANVYGIVGFHYRLVGFIVSAFIAGLGGCLYAIALGFVQPDMSSFLRSIDYLLFAVLGGLGSLTGAVAAAYVLTYLQEFLRFLDDYRLLIYPLILIVLMISRPNGLFRREFSFARFAGKLFNLRKQDRRKRQERRSLDRRRGERRKMQVPYPHADRRNSSERRGVEDRRESRDRRKVDRRLITEHREDSKEKVLSGFRERKPPVIFEGAESSILDIDGISITFGGLTAVNNFSCKVGRGELVGLIGPNGSGKTMIFNIISGIYAPTAGEITFWDKTGAPHFIAGMKCPAINRLGIARTFQNIRLFQSLSVEDNVRAALHSQRIVNPLDILLRLPKFQDEERWMREQTQELLHIFRIDRYKRDYAGNLAYGDQRKLEIARALAANPSLLLLDEPAAGMNSQETLELSRLITFIREQFDLTIILIEHDVRLMMEICERLFVLNYGQLIAQGHPDEIKQNPVVIKTYLGDDASGPGEAEDDGHNA
jgi:branched-chain amino acid transport system permease protein